MPDTNTHPELPPPACIVTNVGNDKPQSFMLALVHGVALANQPAGSTLSLYTAEQVRAAILADRSRTLQSIEAKTADRDAVTVNLMRLFRLDKREARATADFIQGRVDQDARDAKRYRWLRSQHESDEAESYCVFHDRDGGLDPVGSLPGELDEAIDAAMDAVKEPR